MKLNHKVHYLSMSYTMQSKIKGRKKIQIIESPHFPKDILKSLRNSRNYNSKNNPPYPSHLHTVEKLLNDTVPNKFF